MCSNPSAPPVVVVARVYQGNATEADTRKFAHQFADEIIARLSGGVAGNRVARRLRSSASAAATKRSGPWITTAQISTNSLHCTPFR